MSARRTKASRRAAFRGWLARVSTPTAPVWVVRLDPALLRHEMRRMKRALREMARLMAAALRSAARVLVLSFDCPGVASLDTAAAPGVRS